MTDRTAEDRMQPAANSSRTAASPMRGRPFQKGQSGNPRGRPRRDHDVAALARLHTSVAVRTLVEIMTNKRAPCSARVQAANAILDRGYGRPPQSLDLKREISLAQEFENLIRDMNGLRPTQT